MGKVIVVALQKGGVGKTTTVTNIAAVLAQKGKKIILVDFDPQGNAGMCFGIDPDGLDKTIYNVFTGEAELRDIIIKTKFGVDIIPANDDLSQLDMLILQNSEAFPNPVHVLKEALAPVIGEYDYVFIDLPPSLSLLTINGLSAADEVIIPMQCEYLATSGVNKLLRTITNVKKVYNPDLTIRGIVGTMFNSRTNLSTIVLQEARKFFGQAGIKVFNTTIARSVRFGEAPMNGEPAIIRFKDDAVQEYKRLTEEIFGDG